MTHFRLVRYWDARLHALKGAMFRGETNFLVRDHTKRGKVFSSLKEASAYAHAYWEATGDIINVTQTKRGCTHRWEVTK